ncbi:MAG: class I tRNA ligase family protein [Candidatus Aminicenantes bacterium]|nr:class I tRNA ligase family protein [Candidatus Aminicenantes bacterium]
MEKVYNFIETEKKRHRVRQEIKLLAAGNHTGQQSFLLVLSSGGVDCPLPLEQVLIFTGADIIVRRRKMQDCFTFLCPRVDFTETAARETAGWEQEIDRLGIFVDWSRVKSAPVSREKEIVIEAFVQLFTAGKIYRGEREQWFLKSGEMTASAVDAVEQGDIRFFPAKWAKIFVDWLRSSGDWCISRSTGRGYRVPAYCCGNCGSLSVTGEQPGVCSRCASKDIVRETGFLDARFVSAFRPFLLLSREEQPGAAVFRISRPMDLMVAGFDMLFSQAAGMVMMGLHFGKEVPFREVLVNGVIKGDKAADNIEAYGADAFRFSLALQAIPGTAVTFSSNRLKGSRAFINKIWNAARYTLLNLAGDEDFDIDVKKITTVDKWILHYLNKTIVKVNEHLDNFRVNKAAQLLYRFARREYCGWYLEFSRGDIDNLHTRKVLKIVLFRLLQLLHPFIPFVTEEIYQKIETGAVFLLHTEFPSLSSDIIFNEEYQHIELLKKVITGIRRTRTGNRIAANKKIKVFLKSGSEKEKRILSKEKKYFDFLAGSSGTAIVKDFRGLPKGFRGLCRNWEILLPFAGEEERLAELARLKQELEKVSLRVLDFEEKLAHEAFVDEEPVPSMGDYKKRTASAPYEGPGKHIPDQVDRKVRFFSKLSRSISKKRLQQAIAGKEKIEKTIHDIS